MAQQGINDQQINSNYFNSSLNQYRQAPLLNSLTNQTNQTVFEVDYSDYLSQKDIYKWRQKTHHPILKITSIKENITHHQVLMTSQKIIHTLDQLQSMKIQEIIYSMSQMLLGYQEIYMRLKFVCIEQRLIGLNDKGELLLWVNQNPVKNTPGAITLTTQNQIITKTISILQSKCVTQTYGFFTELLSLPKTFKNYLGFLMHFKIKHKLKIIPKIKPNLFKNKITKFCGNDFMGQQKHENIRKQTENISSNLKIEKNNTHDLFYQNFSSIKSAENNNVGKYRHSELSPLITSMSTRFISAEKKQLGFGHEPRPNNIFNTFSHNTQSQSQFFSINKGSYEQQIPSLNLENMNSNKSSTIYLNSNQKNLFNKTENLFNKIQNRFDIQPQSVKSSSKINFSYSQNRHDLSLTPRQTTLIRDFTSDRRIPGLIKMQFEAHPIKQFTLAEDKRETNEKNMSRSANDIKKKVKLQKRKIVPSYTIYYEPVADKITLQNQLQLKKSSLSSLSQKTFKSQQDYNTLTLNLQKQNKTSIVTNYRSAASNSHQSSGKYSGLGSNSNNVNVNVISTSNLNEDGGLDGLGRKVNTMFASNNSHRVCYSIVKSGLVENEGVKNTKSIMLNTSQDVINDNIPYINNTSQYLTNLSQQKFLINSSNQIDSNPTLYINRNLSPLSFNNSQSLSLMNPNIKRTLTTSLFPKQLPVNTYQPQIEMKSSQQNRQQLSDYPSMYTFGGLIVPKEQQQTKSYSNVENNGANQEAERINKVTVNDIVTEEKKIKLSTTSIKSIQQLYKDINSKSEKKSIILNVHANQNIQNLSSQQNDQNDTKDNNVKEEVNLVETNEYKVQLNPIVVGQQQAQITPIKRSYVIKKGHNNNPQVPYADNNQYMGQDNNTYYNNNFKKNIQYLLSPVHHATHNSNINTSHQLKGTNHQHQPHQNNQPFTHYEHHSLQESFQQLQRQHTLHSEQDFDYNQWRGITGLLNESNMNELKQSIHCGPEIRAPLNIKLDLLDKFGREIGHSILPSTPSGHLISTPRANNNFTNSCVRSFFLDEQ